MFIKSILIRAHPSQLVLAWLWNTKAMPQKELILHVGFHKSGTSALQESLANQRDDLHKAGVLYPSIGKKAHHRVAWGLSQKPWGWKARGAEKTPYKTFSRMASLINLSQAQRIVLSSEFFAELEPDKIQKLADTIKNRQIKILFTLRPLAKLLSSSYQQYLKFGLKADYVEWLHSVLDEPGVSKLNPTFWKRHMHGEVVSKWASIFGAENVSVLIVDEQRPEFLYEQINAYLGLPAGLLKSQSSGSNRSLSLEEVTLLLELNRGFPKSRQWSEYLTFIRNGYVRQLTDHVPIKQGAAKLPTPSWAIDKANSLATESKNTITALGVQVIGDLQSLDSATVIAGEPSYPTSIDIATVSAAMLGFDRKLTMRLPVGWMFSALKKRLKAQLRFLGR
jgi:hypothetical protein